MPTNSQSFYDVLTAAIEDMAKHGFDSQERVMFWSKQIREAAERVTKSQAQMEQMLQGFGDAEFIALGFVGEFAAGVGEIVRDFPLGLAQPRRRHGREDAAEEAGAGLRLNLGSGFGLGGGGVGESEGIGEC